MSEIVECIRKFSGKKRRVYTSLFDRGGIVLVDFVSPRAYSFVFFCGGKGDQKRLISSLIYGIYPHHRRGGNNLSIDILLVRALTRSFLSRKTEMGDGVIDVF